MNAAMDRLIAPLVQCLNESGFSTIGSCQGGDGHAFDFPTIQLRPAGDLDDARKELCRFMLDHNWEGFTVRTVSMHQRSEKPEQCSYIELEIWSNDALKNWAN